MDETGERDDRGGDVYEFECPRCGEEASVPFTPKSPDRILCKQCYKETDGRTYDLSKMPHAPRRKHGTRVTFNITCAKCGKDEALDYVPKGVPPDEILCTDCFAKESGDSRWKLVAEQKRREQGRRRRSYPFECDSCGKESTLPFEPKEDRNYYCSACFDSETGEPHEPTHSDAPKHDLGDNVFIRPGDTKD